MKKTNAVVAAVAVSAAGSLAQGAIQFGWAARANEQRMPLVPEAAGLWWLGLNGAQTQPASVVPTGHEAGDDFMLAIGSSPEIGARGIDAGTTDAAAVAALCAADKPASVRVSALVTFGAALTERLIDGDFTGGATIVR